ncbi:IucA/IucC family siderophore biosynthesis protein [Kribbella capetownensis]|uniref:IucA/IucC family siderophore biosynthesis protein n=1 Tax=Kribbella capetownensis TaxID=1572659 RepID=A0A4R0JNQ7_9ACTN|nr:IucA/IucC family siderophore biosynthesis protein [Kribbella capetownensis]TCC46586.1 IucA/IucC family siderophore biosynthesis protein [Kribbella capetownensis]
MTDHLNPEAWAVVNRALVRKALAEFIHERILEPVATDNGYAVGRYEFSARLYPLNHWQIDAVSRSDGGAVDALDFITEFHQRLGIGADMLPVYLEEISSTLASAAYKLSKPDLTAADLVTADFQTIEAAMTEGHPCFVANNGRLGFGVTDYLAFAPETGAAVRLTWIAVRKDRATVSHSSSITYDELLRDELGDDVLREFAARIVTAGCVPADYVYLPVHPWQWENKTSITFAADIAQRHIILVGSSADEYQPQQSIRTFFNRSQPSRHYVKTALSVLNMGFMRGLSPTYMAATPAINDWVFDLVENDLVLKRYGFSILREIAAAGYHNRYYEAATQPTSPYRKMLSALWRESPLPALESGERLATMASLLHVDRHNSSLAAALIRASGLAPADWLRAYADAYLIPLVHSFYAYELVFMPHGENLILVLRDAVPIRVIMKDIAEEIAVMDPETPLPADAERVRAEVPDDEKLLSIFTDIFDCIFRFLSPLLDREGLLTPAEFWSVVSDSIRDYQAATPELAAAFAKYDIFAPTFALSCLNRLQLRNNQQMVDLTDVAGSLQFAGTLHNPIS